MRNLTWLCVFGLLVATLLPGSWQMALQAGSDLDDLKVRPRIKRHGEGSFSSDLAEYYEQKAMLEFLEKLKRGEIPTPRY